MDACIIGLIVWCVFSVIIVYCALASRDDDRVGRG